MFNHGYDYRLNWTIQIEVLLQFYHNHYNFREKQLHFVFVKELLIPIIQNYGIIKETLCNVTNSSIFALIIGLKVIKGD